jgi:hypothetical protein
MKKIILTVAAVFVLSFANAQDGDGLKFGVKAGLNLSNLTGDGSPTMKVGFHIGGFMEYKLSEKFAIQPELLYSTQGAKYEFSESFDGESYSEEFNYKFSYLNIPIMAKYYVSEKFSLEAGPQIGFLLNADSDYDYSETIAGETYSESGTTDIKDFINSTDFAINFGAGYDFNEKISLGLRYNLGLTDVEKDLEPGASGIKNSVFQLSFGYKF